MESDEKLEPALRTALAVLDERDLAQVRLHAAADPIAPPERAPAISDAARSRLIELRAGAVAAELRRCALLALELVAWSDERYPPALLDLVAPPPVLYLRGRGPWPPVDPVTIVGARASTARGRAFARDLGAGVVRRGGAVVSGFAIGIDQAAHEGALEAQGTACAVLACGVDRIYPPGAAPLARRLEAAGRIVSEMPLGAPPYKNHFPRRNRILAALAKATLVVEADLHSGSLLTAHRALELGRGVHAVPGSIDAPTSRGTNRLLRDGAHPLLAVDDLDVLLGRKPSGGEGEALLAVLAAPSSAEALAARLGRPLEALLVRLVELEAEGRVTRLGGGLYVRAPAAP